MRTIVYVDGFNLYYRILKSHPQYKWINPLSLAQSLLSSTNTVVKLRYFTARVKARVDPDAPRRQQLYLDALGTVPNIEIHYGTFLEAKVWAGLVPPSLDPRLPRAKPPFQPWPDVVRVYKTEEKGSDVNIASHLLMDGFQNSYDVAVVLSNDSDLVEPIRMVTTILNKPVGLMTPVTNPNPQLLRASSFVRRISVSDLAPAQFPGTVTMANGRQVTKPATWV